MKKYFIFIILLSIFFFGCDIGSITENANENGIIIPESKNLKSKMSFELDGELIAIESINYFGKYVYDEITLEDETDIYDMITFDSYTDENNNSIFFKIPYNEEGLYNTCNYHSVPRLKDAYFEVVISGKKYYAQHDTGSVKMYINLEQYGDEGEIVRGTFYGTVQTRDGDIFKKCYIENGSFEFLRDEDF